LVAERRAVSRLLSIDSMKKISKIDNHIGLDLKRYLDKNLFSFKLLLPLASLLMRALGWTVLELNLRITFLLMVKELVLAMLQ